MDKDKKIAINRYGYKEGAARTNNDCRAVGLIDSRFVKMSRPTSWSLVQFTNLSVVNRLYTRMENSGPQENTTDYKRYYEYKAMYSESVSYVQVLERTRTLFGLAIEQAGARRTDPFCLEDGPYHLEEQAGARRTDSFCLETDRTT